MSHRNDDLPPSERPRWSWLAASVAEQLALVAVGCGDGRIDPDRASRIAPAVLRLLGIDPTDVGLRRDAETAARRYLQWCVPSSWLPATEFRGKRLMWRVPHGLSSHLVLGGTGADGARGLPARHVVLDVLDLDVDLLDQREEGHHRALTAVLELPVPALVRLVSLRDPARSRLYLPDGSWMPFAEAA